MSDIRLQMSYEEEHAARLERYPPHREVVDRLRELVAREHATTTGPLARLTFVELEEAARFPVSKLPNANAHARVALRMCIRVAGEYGGATPLAPEYFELAKGSGYQLEIASGMLQPAPAGRMASALEEHFAPGLASRTTAKQWQRARFRFARLRDIVGAPSVYAGIAPQTPSAASAPASTPPWRDCPRCGWRHYRQAEPCAFPATCESCDARLDGPIV